MRRTAIILCLLLAACGGHRVVSVPTPVPCVRADQLPEAPGSVKPDLTGDARRDVPVLAVAVLQWRDYAGKLRALLEGCKQ
jgi:hypothetical protein